MDYTYILLLIIASFLVSFMLVPVTISIAHHIGALSIPKDRHIHKKVTPLLGGIAIFLSYMSVLVVGTMLKPLPFKVMSEQIPTILAASIILLLVGIIDDIKPIKPRYKLLAQIIAAIFIVYIGDMGMDRLFSFLPEAIDVELAKLLSIFWIVSVVNAINIVDGLNGLSAGVSIIYFATILVVASFTSANGIFAISIASVMIGSIAGYLPWNFPKAKVFMGDAGSMLLGLIIAIMPFLGFKQVTLISLFIPMTMMIIPVYEIFSTIIRRIINKKSISEADNGHIHYFILGRTKNPVLTVCIIWAISALFSISAIVFEYYGVKIFLITFVALIIIIFFLIVLDKKFDKKKGVEQIFRMFYKKK